MKEELHFQVDSALLKELGEKLVETVHLALSELVKNSYDADASEVKIAFEENKKGDPLIVISDDGIGMNFKQVQNYWLRIATTHKIEKIVSNIYGRPLTGAKGIGRFSCRRLGGKLTLISLGYVGESKSKKLERTEVVFPWTDFEAGKDVTEIICKGERSYVENGNTGTTLIIDNISREWNTRGMNWLKRQLAMLSANRGANRNNFKPDPGFNVIIQGENEAGEIKNLRDDLIHAGWGTLTAYIDKKKRAVCKLEAMGLGERTITSSQTFPNLNDISLELGLMLPNQKYVRDKSTISIGILNNILPEWGGVQVNYRGFRVGRYGDIDWLGIDEDRGLRKAKPKDELHSFAQTLQGIDPSRALLNMLSMRNYIGHVELGEGAKGFEMKLNREGFLDSRAMTELKEFTRFAIDWSTILRDYSIRKEEIDAVVKAQEELQEIITEELTSENIVLSAVNVIESNVKTLTERLDSNTREVVESQLEKATEVIKRQDQSTQSQLNHLRLIASTSTLLLVFQHEVKSLLGMLELNKNSLHRIAKTLPKEQRKELLEIGDNFKTLNTRLSELLQLTSLMSKDHSKSKKGQIALKSRLIKVAKVFELITNKYNIELDYSKVASNAVVRDILEVEVYSILLNVLSNSIKAVIAKSKNRKVEISAERVDGREVITIKDTGIGLSEKRFEEVFIPYVSDPEGKLYEKLKKQVDPEDGMIVGNGTGLGLGIVKEIVLARGGEIYFQTPDKGWASELKIKLK